MKKRAFHPEEVLFSLTSECNLSCRHCDASGGLGKIPKDHALRFLGECKSLGIKRVGFTGGEPFLALDLLCALSRRAVSHGLLFDRIMTNAVWWKDERMLRSALKRLHDSGYDGSICVSVDAFHNQNIKKLARFIEIAVKIWRRPDIVSIAYVHGSKDKETKESLGALKALIGKIDREIFLRTLRIDIAPVGKAEKFKDPWGYKDWFKEDYCNGPGNVFFVMPSGDVKPCCGYATDNKELTIGNIKRDSGEDMIKNAVNNKFVGAVFSRGLSRIRKGLEGVGVRFPGKTLSHCYFCDYILTKVPRRALIKSLAAISIALILLIKTASAQELKIGADYHKIPSKVVRQVKAPKGYHEGLFYDGKSSLWMANGEKGDVWIMDMATGAVTAHIKPVSDFVEALIRSDDGSLYTTEWNTMKIYRVKLDGSQLTVDMEGSFEPAHPAGLTWNGKCLIAITWTRGMGTKYHLIEMDGDLKVINKILIKDIEEPDQLAWDGKYLWLSSWYTNGVYKVNTDTWEIMGYFMPPVSKTTGIAWDGKCMWVTGTHDDLYQIEIES